MVQRLFARLEALVLHALMALPLVVVRRLAGRPVLLDGQLLDPRTQWLLRLRRLARYYPEPETMPVPEMRASTLRQARIAGGSFPIGATDDLEVPGGAGPIRARLYLPRGAAPGGPLLFFVHGGGMVYGDLDTHDATCRFLSERAGVRVLAVDYRLAPEHPYPAAVDDCWTAYQWVSEHAGELGADPERIGVGGDSAGGYLSAVVAIKAAEAGVPVRHQLLLYPVTNMADTSESRRLFGDGFFLTTAFTQLVETLYAGDPRDPLVSIAFTEKIPEDLAPALVVTAGFDPLRDEGEAYARRLASSGVPVEMKRYPGFIHGFANMIGVNPANRAAVAEIAAKLKAALA
jgi:acetyl esterase